MPEKCNLALVGFTLQMIFATGQFIMMMINAFAKNSVTHGKSTRTATWWITVLLTIACFFNLVMSLTMSSSHTIFTILLQVAAITGIISVLLYYSSDQWDKRDHKKCEDEWFIVKSGGWSTTLLVMSFFCLAVSMGICVFNLTDYTVARISKNLEPCAGALGKSAGKGVVKVGEGIVYLFNLLVERLRKHANANAAAR